MSRTSPQQRVPLPWCGFTAALCILCAIAAHASQQNGQATPGPAPGIVSANPQPPGSLPSFEVASIRAVPPNQVRYTSISPYGLPKFTARNISLTILISMAYGIDSRYITGQLKDLDSAVFDIDAKPEGDIALTSEKLQPLLRQMLQQRFHLRTHLETKEISGYALIVAKGGPKLLRTKDAVSNGGYILTDGIRNPSAPMGTIAGSLSTALQHPVSNETGLLGNYDVTLKYAPQDSSDTDLPSIFTAVKEQLGLELKPRKISVTELVVDQVDKLPTAN